MKMLILILKVYYFINFYVEVIFQIFIKFVKFDVEVVGYYVIVFVFFVVSFGVQEVRDYFFNCFDGKFL